MIILAVAIMWPPARANIKKDLAVLHNGDNFIVQSISSGMEKSGASFDSIDLNKQPVFSCDNYTTFVSIGYDAITASLKKCGVKKVVAIETSDNITQLRGYRRNHIRYVYVEQRPSDVINDVSRHFKSIRTIGVLVESESEKVIYQNLLRHVKSKIVYKIVPDGDAPGVSFMKLIEETDAIFVTTNSKIWQPYKIKAFLLAGIRRGKVLVGGVSPQYIKAGVFAGTYTDFDSLGKEIGNAVRNGKLPIASGYYRKSEFTYNKIIAERFESLN